MSVEFRQRTPAEYLKILRRRKWLIILPVFAVTCAVIYVVYKLPDVYQSSTLIVVKPSTLPQSVMTMSTEDAMTRQLSSIAQVLTSRSSLEPLVEKYELYKAERLRGEPMESIIGMMHNDIKVDVNTTRNDITNGFDISLPLPRSAHRASGHGRARQQIHQRADRRTVELRQGGPAVHRQSGQANER